MITGELLRSLVCWDGFLDPANRTQSMRWYFNKLMLIVNQADIFLLVCPDSDAFHLSIEKQ